MLLNLTRNAAIGAALAVMPTPAPAFTAATDYKFEVVAAQPAEPQNLSPRCRKDPVGSGHPRADCGRHS